MFKEYKLLGNCIADLDTEIRFLLAGARVDGEELIKLFFDSGENERENVRTISCIVKVLRVLKREKLIQFFVGAEDFSAGTTESDFLLNKYASYIDNTDNSVKYVYVKL